MKWITTIALIAFLQPAFGHDHEHPELDDWFGALRNKSEFLCCDKSEATHIANVDWDTKDGHYRVRLNGEWWDVPPGAVITAPNLDGRTLVWPIPGYQGRITGIRCFMPGSMT